MDDEKQNEHEGRQNIGFLIALLRGLLAIALGIILIFNPDKSKGSLFNLMGGFWVTSGLILIRHTHPVFDQQQDRILGKRLSVVGGLLGILAGLLVLTRFIAMRIFQEVLVFEILGAIILLTGVLHLLGEVRIKQFFNSKRTAAQIILAIFEIVLGALLIFSPLDQGSIVYWTATLWAFVGGGLIISDALYQRVRARRQRKSEAKLQDNGASPR